MELTQSQIQELFYGTFPREYLHYFHSPLHLLGQPFQLVLPYFVQSIPHSYGNKGSHRLGKDLLDRLLQPGKVKGWEIFLQGRGWGWKLPLVLQRADRMRRLRLTVAISPDGMVLR